jgi:GMP synthase (glutamine-hydrolysing)
MRPILVIEQERSLEGLGLLGDRLDRSGLPYRRLQIWETGLDGIRAGDFAAIVPMGGNSHAWQEDAYSFLRRERLLLAEAVDEGVPVLGICLGAQLLARALGAEVRAAEEPEIGWLDVHPTVQARDDPVFGHLGGALGTYQWHNDVFELPPGAQLLARSEQYENQGFRVGNAWGIQFHPEVDPELFELWISRHPDEVREAGVDTAALREAVYAGADVSRPLRASLFDGFLDVVGERWPG